MDANSTLAVKVEGGGDQLVAHVGLHALGSFADRVGLGKALSTGIPITGDLAPCTTGARFRCSRCSCSLLAVSAVAASMASAPKTTSSAPWLRTPTTNRTFRQVRPPPSLGCGRQWRRLAPRCGDELAPPPGYFDIDASLVQIHSENKEDSAPTYKVGFGFHPMLCFADATGEALGAVAPGQCRAVDRHGIP